MAEILVRNLDEEVVKQLKSRAARSGRSLQSEVKNILELAASAPAADAESAIKLALAVRRRFKGRAFPDSAKLIREDRDR